MTHARYLCKRIQARYPDASIIVGLWTFRGNLQKARERVTHVASVQIATTLIEAQSQLDQLSQPLLISAGSGSASPAVSAK